MLIPEINDEKWKIGLKIRKKLNFHKKNKIMNIWLAEKKNSIFCWNSSYRHIKTILNVEKKKLSLLIHKK